MGNFYICAKQITFGGRENLDYEKRIQIKGDSNNLVESKIDENTQGFLLGIIEIDKEPILCTFMVKHSDALNTLSKQIKISTIYEAKENGFAQQRKGKEYACAFKKEFLYFYLKSVDWIHKELYSKNNRHM